MKIQYDPEADALYIYLSDKPYSYGKDLDSERRIDFASDDTAIGIELLCVSKGVNPDDLPNQEEVIRLLEAKNFKVFA